MGTNRTGLLPSVGVAARDQGGRLLFVRRADDGRWCFPGGAVEVGESWRAAALRECREETGWVVRLTGLLGIYSDPSTQTHVYPDGGRVQFVGVIFEAVTVELLGQPDGECSQVCFFSEAELPAVLFEPDRPIVEDAVSSAARPFLR